MRFDEAATALNAVWLHGPPDWSRALVLDADGRRREAVIRCLERLGVDVAAMSHEPESAPEPGADATPFDLIWIGGDSGSDSPVTEAVVRRWRRALTPGGHLVLFAVNPWYLGRRPSGSGTLTGLLGARTGGGLTASGRTAAVLNRLGLATRSRHYLHRNTPQASSMIPCSGPAAGTYEGEFRATRKSLVAGLRSRVAGAGLHGALYPFRVLVAAAGDEERREPRGPVEERDGRSGLLDVVREAGAPGLDSVAASQVLLVTNRALLPWSGADASSAPGGGFNAVILGAGDRPAYFAKCRSVRHPGGEREAALLTALSGDPELADLVPPSWSFETGGMRVLLSRYLPGRTLHDLLTSGRARDVHGILSAIFERCDRLRAATEDASPVRRQPASLAGRAEAHLAALRRARPSDDAAIDVLEAALAAGGDPGHEVQHGDLWPQNIVRSDESWWLLDFEAYGTVTVPLFDTFQLVWSTAGLLERSAATGERSAAVLPDDARELVRRRIERKGLEARSLNGVFAYFVVRTLARHVESPGASSKRSRAAELHERAATALEDFGDRPVDPVELLDPGPVA